MSSKKGITRYISVICIVLCLLGLSMFSFGVFGLGGKTQFKKEYKENIQSNNLYKYLSQYEVLDFLNNETGVIYFGYPENPWCKRIVSVLNECAFSNGMDKIYYYNIKEDQNILSLNENKKIKIDKQGTNFYNELLKELKGNTSKYILEDENGNKYDTGKMRINAPYVAFVKDGKVLSYHEGIVDSYNDINESLTQQQWDELYNIYEKGFELINETKEEK